MCGNDRIKRSLEFPQGLCLALTSFAVGCELDYNLFSLVGWLAVCFKESEGLQNNLLNAGHTINLYNSFRFV